MALKPAGKSMTLDGSGTSGPSGWVVVVGVDGVLVVRVGKLDHLARLRGDGRLWAELEQAARHCVDCAEYSTDGGGSVIVPRSRVPLFSVCASRRRELRGCGGGGGWVSCRCSSSNRRCQSGLPSHPKARAQVWS